MTPLLLALAAGLVLAPPAGDPDPARPSPSIAQPKPAPSQAPAPPPTQAPSATPAAAISAEVMVLHGTNDNSGIDPKIGKIPALTKPPFSSFNSYKLLDSAKLPLQRAKSASLKLPTGRDLQLLFKDVAPPPKQGEAQKFVLSASILKPDGKAVLPNVEVNAKAGEWFFLAGQDYKGGSLVIGIKVAP